MPDEFTDERLGLAAATVAELKAKGHVLTERGPNGGRTQGDAESIAIDPKTNHRRGAADPRSSAARAAGY